MIEIHTSKGTITLELDMDNTPKTTSNFLHYVNEGFYNNTIFHRVIKNFMIQGGGMDADMLPKETGAPIENEADKGGSNKRGTIAMARTSNPHSASTQFFINHRDNGFLDFKSKDSNGWGYCVFGRVVSGMEVVDAIAMVPTTSRAGHGDAPEEVITIESILEVIEAE